MTTNSTLKQDLEASVKASTPVAQLRTLQAQVMTADAKLERLVDIVNTMNDNTIIMLDTLKELVIAQAMAAENTQRVVTAMTRIIDRANSHLDHVDTGDVQ